MGERRTGTGSPDFRALDDGAVEALAFGPETPADTAAAARTELLRRHAGREARRTPAPQAPDTEAVVAVPRGAEPTAAAPVPDATDHRTDTDGADAAPTLPSVSAEPRPDARRAAGPGRRRTVVWSPRPVWPRGLVRLRARLSRTWVLVLGTAVVAGALGAVGTVAVGRLGPAVVQDGSSDSGSETLTRVLARGQTAEDELPSTLQAPVDRSSARLLFANYADRPPVPWAVWIARARSGGDVCFIASPDRYATDITCLPGRQALGGHVSYTTRDGAQGLAVRVDGGVARIDLIGGD